MDTIDELLEWLSHYDVVATDKDILNWTKRSARTLQRWKNEGIPSWVHDCVVRNTGLIQVSTSKSFEIWRVLESGDVICPAGVSYKLSEIRAMVYYKQAMNGYRLRALSAEREIQRIKQEHGQQGGPPAANDRQYSPERPK